MPSKTALAVNIDGEEEHEEHDSLLDTGKGGDGAQGGVKAVLQWMGALGVVFFLAMEAMGYQALLPALYSSGQFEWLCSEEEIANRSGGNTEAACNAQQAQLDLMFTLGYVGLNIAAFPLAALLHRYPPKYITCGSFLCKGIAYILLALGTDGAQPWLGTNHAQYLAHPAYALVASLGLSASLPFLNLPPMLFPAAYIALANTSLMGSADASSLVYFIVREIYLHTGVPLRAMFLVYSGLTVIGAVVSYKLLEDVGVGSQQSGGEGIWVRVKRRKFAVFTGWHSVFFVMKYFYMTNITAEGRWMTGSEDQAYSLNTAFSVIMPATGVLTPFVGWVLSKGFKPAILLNALLAAIIGVTSSIHSYPLGYPMLFCVAASRFMVFSIVPTLMSHDAGYGPEGSTFFSLATGIAGGASTVNFGLSTLARHHDAFREINLTLTGCCLVATVILYRYLAREGVK